MKLNVLVDLDFISEDGCVSDFVKEEIIAASKREILKSLQDEIKNTIAKEARGMVTGALLIEVTELLKAPFTPIDSWGTPTSDPTTLRDLIKKRYETFMAEKVDEKGDTSYGAKLPRIEYLIKKAVTDQFNYEFKAVLEAEAKKAKQVMALEISKVLADSLVKATR